MNKKFVKRNFNKICARQDYLQRQKGFFINLGKTTRSSAESKEPLRRTISILLQAYVNSIHLKRKFVEYTGAREIDESDKYVQISTQNYEKNRRSPCLSKLRYSSRVPTYVRSQIQKKKKR